MSVTGAMAGMKFARWLVTFVSALLFIVAFWLVLRPLGHHPPLTQGYVCTTATLLHHPTLNPPLAQGYVLRPLVASPIP